MRKLKFVSVFILLILLLGFGLQTRAGSYDRDAGVAWIDAHAHDRPSDYPNYGSGPGCNDCTNYVNQMLDKGGYPQRKGDDDIWHRYCYKKWWWRVSQTWYNTDKLNWYVAQYQDGEFEYRGWPDQLEKGDFYLMDLRNNENPNDPNPDGKADHARAIVGWDWTSTNSEDYVPDPVPPQQWALLSNQHCLDRWHVPWDFRVPGSVPRWSIHVKW